MKVFNQKVERDGITYNNISVAWIYNNRVYYVRVRPVFGKDNKQLISMAEEIPATEPIEKYM